MKNKKEKDLDGTDKFLLSRFKSGLETIGIDLDYIDKFLLSRRGLIETVIGQIKEKTNIINIKIKNPIEYEKI